MGKTLSPESVVYPVRDPRIKDRMLLRMYPMGKAVLIPNGVNHCNLRPKADGMGEWDQERMGESGDEKKGE